MVDGGVRGREDGSTSRRRIGSEVGAGRRWDMGTKDKGGSKASKKPAQKDIKQKREAKRSKKAR